MEVKVSVNYFKYYRGDEHCFWIFPCGEKRFRIRASIQTINSDNQINFTLCRRLKLILIFLSHTILLERPAAHPLIDQLKALAIV
jgi:hypothetical protein